MRLSLQNEKSNISGARVRLARQFIGLSQEALAGRLQLMGLQLGQMAISRIETGKRIVPDFELPLLARALNVKVGWLLGLEE